MSSTYLSQSLGGLGVVLMALDSNSSMNMLPTVGLRGDGCTMDLFIILTQKRKYVFFRQDSRNVVICYMDMEVLLCTCEPCCNFCLMIEMTGSTGRYIKRVFTS